ncbi:hypothetical protein KP509_20G041400 [Ceratopteris richardii]|nr:hypothetical protein KP509_20G041400 [Ceratopteris richardii]
MDRHGRRRRYRTWQSIALLLIPAGGFSYPSTPTGKAQLFGAPSFPRTLSGSSIDKQNYKSSFTSGPAMSDWQFSTGRSSQFSSPRTIASSKVQHFSGSIPSPRTPFYTSSPAATARRTHPGQKRPSFSLFSPPGVPSINQKRTAFIHQESTVDEPSSPHVNCIGRVRRQSQCKKLFPTDAIEPSSYRRRRDQATDLRGKSGHSDKSGGTSSSFHDQGLRDKPMGNLRSQTSDSHFVNIKPLVLTDNSIQTFGKLLSLHKDEHHSGHGWTPKTEQNVNRSIATNKIDSPSFDGGSHQEGRPRRKVSGEESDHLWQNNVNMIEDSKIHALQYAASRIDTVAGETKSTEFYSLSSTKLKLDSQERDDDACRHGSREMRTARPTTLDEPERCLIVMRSRGSKRLSDDEIGRLMSIG